LYLQFYKLEKSEGNVVSGHGKFKLESEVVHQKIRSEISEIDVNIAFGFAYSPYGKPINLVRSGIQKSIKNKNITPKIA
jgi:hypothetical protein